MLVGCRQQQGLPLRLVGAWLTWYRQVLLSAPQTRHKSGQRRVHIAIETRLFQSGLFGFAVAPTQARGPIGRVAGLAPATHPRFGPLCRDLAAFLFDRDFDVLFLRFGSVLGHQLCQVFVWHKVRDDASERQAKTRAGRARQRAAAVPQSMSQPPLLFDLVVGVTKASFCIEELQSTTDNFAAVHTCPALDVSFQQTLCLRQMSADLFARITHVPLMGGRRTLETQPPSATIVGFDRCVFQLVHETTPTISVTLFLGHFF